MRAVKPERSHRQDAPVKMGDTPTDMASELTKLSDQLKAELRKKGVVQGLTDVISEPSTQYNCRFLNAHDFENWVSYAEPHMLDKIKMTKRSIFEEIAFGSILQDVNTSHEDTTVCKLLLLLGPAGIGKTTALNRLACHDLLKKKIVIVSDFRMFDPSKKIRPSRALLSKMFSDHDSDRMTQRYRWMKHNSDQVAVIVDSLDTMPFDLQMEHQPIHDDEPVSTEAIAYNLFARKILPSAIVISSSREYKVRNIHKSVRPDRCVIIDGLTDESAKALLEGFLGKEKAAEAMEHIENECPDIWPLLRIPVFLQYTAVAFASQVDGFKPNTMSGILIRFFQNLVRSPHVLVKNITKVLRKLMPMSFAAMREAKVQFTPKDLEYNGVEVAEVTDLGTLVPQQGRLPLVGKLMHDDRFYLYFHHQTMQECLAALHALSIGKTKFKTSVSKEVQKSNFTVVYRIMCGILFNREVLEAALEFVEIPDVEEKRSILLGNLQSNLNQYQRIDKSNVLEVFINLNEAKDGVAELIRSSVRNIDFSDHPLNPSDVQAIAFVMGKCGYLYEVFLRGSDINGEKIDILARNLMRSTLKIDHLDLSKNDLSGRISSVAKIAKHCDVKSLGIRETNLKGEHLDQVIKENHQFQKLDVSWSTEIEAAGWYIVGGLMADNALELRAYGCNLDATKVSELDKGLRSKRFQKLDVSWSTEIEAAGWYIVGGLMADNALELEATGCNLDATKVSELDKGLRSKRFQKLDVSFNEEIEAAGWYIVGGLMADNALELRACGCNLDATKVSELDKGLRSKSVEVLDLNRNYAFGPDYTRALLGLLSHVNKELKLLFDWEINEDDRREFQEKLNEIGSPNLKIIFKDEDWEVILQKEIESSSGEGYSEETSTHPSKNEDSTAEDVASTSKGGEGELTSVEPRHQTARQLSESKVEENSPEKAEIGVRSMDVESSDGEGSFGKTSTADISSTPAVSDSNPPKKIDNFSEDVPSTSTGGDRELTSVEPRHRMGRQMSESEHDEKPAEEAETVVKSLGGKGKLTSVKPRHPTARRLNQSEDEENFSEEPGIVVKSLGAEGELTSDEPRLQMERRLSESKDEEISEEEPGTVVESLELESLKEGSSDETSTAQISPTPAVADSTRSWTKDAMTEGVSSTYKDERGMEVVSLEGATIQLLRNKSSENDGPRFSESLGKAEVPFEYIPVSSTVHCTSSKFNGRASIKLRIWASTSDPNVLLFILRKPDGPGANLKWDIIERCKLSTIKGRTVEFQTTNFSDFQAVIMRIKSFFVDFYVAGKWNYFHDGIFCFEFQVDHSKSNSSIHENPATTRPYRFWRNSVCLNEKVEFSVTCLQTEERKYEFRGDTKLPFTADAKFLSGNTVKAIKPFLMNHPKGGEYVILNYTLKTGEMEKKPFQQKIKWPFGKSEPESSHVERCQEETPTAAISPTPTVPGSTLPRKEEKAAAEDVPSTSKGTSATFIGGGGRADIKDTKIDVHAEGNKIYNITVPITVQGSTMSTSQDDGE